MLQTVTAGNGIDVKGVEVGDRDTMTGISFHFVTKFVMKYAAVITAKRNDTIQKSLEKWYYKLKEDGNLIIYQTGFS